MSKVSEERQAQIRRLNDRFRCQGLGEGSVMITNGIHEKGAAFFAAVWTSVREFAAFGRDNDPYCEHDFGAFDVDGERLFFKFDYYDVSLQGHSPDPADPDVTHRVLTVMLANEY